METLPHDTIITGKDSITKQLVFARSYNYETEKDVCQAKLKEIIDSGVVWTIGAISNSCLPPEIASTILWWSNTDNHESSDDMQNALDKIHKLISTALPGTKEKSPE